MGALTKLLPSWVPLAIPVVGNDTRAALGIN